MISLEPIQLQLIFKVILVFGVFLCLFSWKLIKKRISRSNCFKINRLSVLCVLLIVCLFLTILQEMNRPEEFLDSREEGSNGTAKIISILVVLTSSTNESQYQRALDSLKCYSKIHDYKFIIARDEDYKDVCKQSQSMFRRHCITAQLLNNTDYLLFVDGDIGVVNPQRRIEEFIDDRYDVTLYDRFFNAEIMAGSYLLKNSPVALDFVTGFADYLYKLPTNSFSGSDNGALHAYVIMKLFPDRYEDYRICMNVYNASKNFDDVFIFENCIRSIMGISEVFGPYRILRKLTGWARDNWLTNSLWNPEIDFMIHAWKTMWLRKYEQKDLPIGIHSQGGWIDPIVGDFDFDKCVPGNDSWNHDPNLIAPASTIRKFLAERKFDIQRSNYRTLRNITKFF